MHETERRKLFEVLKHEIDLSLITIIEESIAISIISSNDLMHYAHSSKMH